MEIKIDKLNIILENVVIKSDNIDDLTISCMSNVANDLNKASIDGVFIVYEFEDNKYRLITVDKFTQDYKAVGVAVIEGNKSILVSLDGFGNVQLLGDDSKGLDTPLYKNRKEAYKDFDGEANTSRLLKKDSTAAQICTQYKKGNLNKWWLPSFGEFDLIYRNKQAVNKCLESCKGDILPDEWHWTSTSFSSRSAWIFSWNNGYTYCSNKNYYNRVRPVSALPDLTI